jgi:hypothetical protein
LDVLLPEELSVILRLLLLINLNYWSDCPIVA